MLTPDLTIHAAAFIEGLDAKRAAQIWKKIAQLCDHPTSGDTKRLEGSVYSRTRCGDYRIVFKIDGDTLTVVLVGDRGDVYRLLDRLYP